MQHFKGENHMYTIFPDEALGDITVASQFLKGAYKMDGERYFQVR